MKSLTERHKEFVLYFDELDKKGIPWGISDLRRKAKELCLPVPENIVDWARRNRV